MRRILLVLLASFGIASISAAQFVEFSSGGNSVAAQDSAAYYTSGGTYTYLDLQSVTEGTAFGTPVEVNANPWIADYSNGMAAGNGEAASAQGNFTNNTRDAVLQTFLAANGQISTTLTGPGPYFGVAGNSTAIAQSEMQFTTTQATTMSVLGTVTVFGNNASFDFDLYNVTQGFGLGVVTFGPGAGALNFSQDLVTGDSYVLTETAEAFPNYRFDPTNSIDATGPDATTAFLTVTFASPAPEPLTCGLLGVGAVAILCRRKKSA